MQQKPFVLISGVMLLPVFRTFPEENDRVVGKELQERFLDPDFSPAVFEKLTSLWTISFAAALTSAGSAPNREEIAHSKTDEKIATVGTEPPRRRKSGDQKMRDASHHGAQVAMRQWAQEKVRVI